MEASFYIAQKNSLGDFLSLSTDNNKCGYS